MVSTDRQDRQTVGMLTARLSKDHDTKVHPKQPDPSFNLLPRRLIPHTFTQRRNSLEHKKQRNIPIKPSPHRIRRQLVIQPARGENTKQHSHFREFFRDPRANPVSGVPSKDDE